MTPSSPPDTRNELDMFRSRLDNILNRRHPLFVLAGKIDWRFFEQQFGPLYVEKVGRPGLPIRLLVGLHYLKHTYRESDESVVEKFLENPYWQYFCGFEFFQHHFPLDPSSLVRWRKRVGTEGMEKLLKETIASAQRGNLLRQSDVSRAIADTTVQEKAIAFPTDARLYHKARRTLVRAAKGTGIELRQTYEHLGKRAFQRQSRYAHARQGKRAKRETRKLRTYLGRVIRDLQRKCPTPTPRLANLLGTAQRIFLQRREDSPKVYSVHAPETECIAKGKAHKKYEFGCKVSVVSTAKKNWVIGIGALHGNPYDGHTLKGAIEQAQKLTGWKIADAFVDRGYRGAAKDVPDVNVHLSWKKNPAVRRWLKRRAAIEPIISHLKSDNGMDRNHLKGTEGDRVNAILAGCGFNLRKLLRSFLAFIFGWLFVHHSEEDAGSPVLSFGIAAA
jgi:transposase, IS5 family